MELDGLTRIRGLAIGEKTESIGLGHDDGLMHGFQSFAKGMEE